MGSYETLFSLWHKTLTYSNIFDYPLDEDEIHRYLITSHAIAHDTFTKWLEKNHYRLQDDFEKHETYWMQQGRQPLVTARQGRNQASKKKLKKAKRLTLLFYLLPWVRLIGVTGAVAAKNATQDDDIDLFIITSPKRQWLTRAIILTALTILKRRYRLGHKNTRQTFCLNHIMTIDQLAVRTQDLYIANDIARMKVLWNKANAYRSFLQANQWIKQHLANWWSQKVADLKLDQPSRPARIRIPAGITHVWFVLTAPLRTPLVMVTWALDGLERLTYRIQQRDNTTKELTHHIRDNSGWILREYHLALQQSG